MPLGFLSSQCSFGARNFALFALYSRCSSLDGQRKSLESTLGSVVIVLSTQAVDVYRHASSLGKAFHAVRYHLSAQFAEPFTLKSQLDHSVGSVRQVDNGARQSFVEGCVGRSESGKASRCTQCLVEGIAEGNADIFGRVVIIN